MKKSELRQMIREELLREASVSDEFSKSLQKLISRIKAGEGLDKNYMKGKSVGELLGTILTPIFQSEIVRLDDKKGFYKNFKIGK